MHQTVVSTLQWLTNKYQLNELKVFSKLSNALYDIAGFFLCFKSGSLMISTVKINMVIFMLIVYLSPVIACELALKREV